MFSIYQKVFIALFLLIVFAGRISVSAFPAPKLLKEISKSENQNSDKTESSEKQTQLEEKDKLSDLHIDKLSSIEFLYFHKLNKILFLNEFNLTHFHLQIPEQPPK